MCFGFNLESSTSVSPGGHKPKHGKQIKYGLKNRICFTDSEVGSKYGDERRRRKKNYFLSHISFD